MEQERYKKQFEEIYNAYYPKVLLYFSSKINQKETAEDLTSEVFLRCFRKIDSYDSEKASMSTWIFVIARNVLKNHYRDRKNIQSIDSMEHFELEYQEDFDRAIILEEVKEYMDRVLAELDEVKREIILLKYYDELKTEEIATKLGLSPTNVRTIMSRTMMKIRNLPDSNLIRLEF